MSQGTLNSTITSYQPVLIASQDYYPFGMQMDSRGDNSLNTSYRFDFYSFKKDYKERINANEDNTCWSNFLGLPNIQNSVNPEYKTSIDQSACSWEYKGDTKKE